MLKANEKDKMKKDSSLMFCLVEKVNLKKWIWRNLREIFDCLDGMIDGKKKERKFIKVYEWYDRYSW